MNIYQFMSEHPYLTFFLALLIVECAAKIVSRTLRSINVAIRGWPPAHLDADGDWKPKQDEQP